MVGLVFGLAFFVPLLSWLINLAWYAWAALAIAEAVIFALLAVGQRLLLGCAAWPVAVAAWWVAAEALRARWPYAFPWGRLAMSQAQAPTVPVGRGRRPAAADVPGRADRRHAGLAAAASRDGGPGRAARAGPGWRSPAAAGADPGRLRCCPVTAARAGHPDARSWPPSRATCRTRRNLPDLLRATTVTARTTRPPRSGWPRQVARGHAARA